MPPAAVTAAVTAAGTPAVGALVPGDLDELAGDPGAGEALEGAGRQLGGELDDGEVGLCLLYTSPSPRD